MANEKEADDNAIRERVEQIHHAYLDIIFKLMHYEVQHAHTTKYSRHFDFAIGLGAAGSGGSGLGILADPLFAVPCAVITSVSVILAIAKNHYDWHGRVKTLLEMIQFYQPLATEYEYLVHDMNHARKWEQEFDKTHRRLRETLRHAPNNPYPHLKEDELRAIQNRVKHRIPYSKWWKP